MQVTIFLYLFWNTTKATLLDSYNDKKEVTFHYPITEIGSLTTVYM